MAHLSITLDGQALKELLLGDCNDVVTKLLESVFNAILSAEASNKWGLNPVSGRMAV